MELHASKKTWRLLGRINGSEYLRNYTVMNDVIAIQSALNIIRNWALDDTTAEFTTLTKEILEPDFEFMHMFENYWIPLLPNIIREIVLCGFVIVTFIQKNDKKIPILLNEYLGTYLYLDLYVDRSTGERRYKVNLLKKIFQFKESKIYVIEVDQYKPTLNGKLQSILSELIGNYEFFKLHERINLHASYVAAETPIFVKINEKVDEMIDRINEQVGQGMLFPTYMYDSGILQRPFTGRSSSSSIFSKEIDQVDTEKKLEKRFKLYEKTEETLKDQLYQNSTVFSNTMMDTKTVGETSYFDTKSLFPEPQHMLHILPSGLSHDTAPIPRLLNNFRELTYLFTDHIASAFAIPIHLLSIMSSNASSHIPKIFELNELQLQYTILNWKKILGEIFTKIYNTLYYKSEIFIYINFKKSIASTIINKPVFSDEKEFVTLETETISNSKKRKTEEKEEEKEIQEEEQEEKKPKESKKVKKKKKKEK